MWSRSEIKGIFKPYGFVLGVRRSMAGEDAWGGETTVDLTYPEIGNGIADGWRGVQPNESSPRTESWHP